MKGNSRIYNIRIRFIIDVDVTYSINQFKIVDFNYDKFYLMYFQLYIPAGLWGAVLIMLLVIVSHAGLYFFDHWCKKKNISHNNEVAGIIFGVISLIYSLLVAFVIVAVWENYEDLNRTIEKEADDLNTVIIHSNALPDSLRNPIEASVKDYCLKVVKEEWGIPEDKEHLRQAAIPSLRQLLFQVQLSNKAEENVLNLLDNKLSEITVLRRERLSHIHSYVPQLVWMILIISSIMIVLFSYFLYVDSELLKKIFLTFLWAMMGMSLFLMYMLDHPFIGSTQVSKEPYETIIMELGGQ